MFAASRLLAVLIAVPATPLLVLFGQPRFLRFFVPAILNYVPDFLASETGTSFGMITDYLAPNVVLAAASA